MTLKGHGIPAGAGARRGVRGAFVLPRHRYPFFDKLVFAVFVLLVPAVLGSAPRIFADGDVSWHVATGRWILAHGQVPATDPFSFTMAGRPWVAHEWLAEIVYAAAFELARYSGLAAVVTGALVLLHLILFVHLRRIVGPIGLLLSFVALDLALSPFILARPHILVWPLLAAWTVALLRAADAGRAPPLWLALLMIAWVNLHGSFVLGFLIYGAFALDACIASNWSRPLFRSWTLVGVLLLAATLVNANGLAALAHPFTITGMETLPYIQEWQPSSIAHTPFFFAVLLFVILALAFRRPAVPLGQALLLVVLLAMALSQVRHQSWLAILAAAILAPRLAGQGRRDSPPLFAGRAERRAWLGAAAAAGAALLALRLAVPAIPKETEGNPRGLIAAVPKQLGTQPVLNGYSMGGPLILAGIRPYIDGRADMYGDRFVEDWRRMVDGDVERFDRAVARYGIRWTMLPHGDKGLIRALDASREWRRLYADRVGVIHVRDMESGAPASAR